MSQVLSTLEVLQGMLTLLNVNGIGRGSLDFNRASVYDNRKVLEEGKGLGKRLMYGQFQI